MYHTILYCTVPFFPSGPHGKSQAGPAPYAGPDAWSPGTQSAWPVPAWLSSLPAFLCPVETKRPWLSKIVLQYRRYKFILTAAEVRQEKVVAMNCNHVGRCCSSELLLYMK